MIKRLELWYCSPIDADAPFGCKDDSRRYLRNLAPVAENVLKLEDLFKSLLDKDCYSQACLENASLLRLCVHKFEEENFEIASEIIPWINNELYLIESSKKGYNLVEKLLLKKDKKLKKSFAWPLRTERYIVNK
ncbi:MAG: hypothetical protein KJ646_04585 [Nanoarchaeota archaeon]|nr:hypothetical protein [Nanoarchaeota archaeon]MBU4116503.1 hypothetical protein [Nanoarchaeota archaeon]